MPRRIRAGALTLADGRLTNRSPVPSWPARGRCRAWSRRILQAVDSRRLDLPQIRVAPSATLANEVVATMNVDADLAERVRQELASGRTPVTISADCISCLGTLGGLTAGVDARAERVGVVWLDAHGDFNTAASSPTGYLDGMALAAAVGREGGRSRRASPVSGRSIRRTLSTSAGGISTWERPSASRRRTCSLFVPRS